LDSRAERQNLCSFIPPALPSDMLPLRFEGCPKPGIDGRPTQRVHPFDFVGVSEKDIN
jgi:hypothetical protein